MANRYTFDVIYVTWFVHTTTALVSAKFWWLYLSVRYSFLPSSLSPAKLLKWGNGVGVDSSIRDLPPRGLRAPLHLAVLRLRDEAEGSGRGGTGWESTGAGDDGERGGGFEQEAGEVEEARVAVTPGVWASWASTRLSEGCFRCRGAGEGI